MCVWWIMSVCLLLIFFCLFQEQQAVQGNGGIPSDSVLSLVPGQTIQSMPDHLRSESKVHRFMFVYKGLDFRPEIIADLINRMDAGLFGRDMKYCIMRAPISVYLSRLPDIVTKYNQRVEEGSQITLVRIRDLSGEYLPSVMPMLRMKSNPIQHKLEYDRKNYRNEVTVWKHPSA